MSYYVKFSAEAKKALKKLDKHTAAFITGWIRKNLEGCEDPRLYGKGLTANHRGKWRYRIGDYRLLCEIRDAELVILALNVGHHREVYK